MAMVSSSMGPINSLLDKLDGKPEFMDLWDDLLSIRKDLLEFSARGVVRSMLVQRWMKQVRELAYDIEDWIDGLLIIRSAGGSSSQPELGSCDVVAQMEEFKVQIHDAQDRCIRYNLLKKLPASDADLADLMPSEVTVDTKLPLEEKPGLVGLTGQESELLQHLTDDEKRLKVVSIVGSGGLGKTTLATAVYRELQSQFECRAFIYAGRNPSTRTTLTNILHQVMPSNLRKETWHEEQVITKLWEFLCRKRYLMVIDDIWCTWVWSAISCALPDNNLGSRILVTTRIDDVANSCCLQPNDFVYSMKALSDHDAMSLIFNKISVREEDWPFVSKILLKICAGTPLAILVTVGLLDIKRAEQSQCKMLEKAFISAHNQDSTTQGMIKILDICYADLPLPMKSCFLYMSDFPENYTIEKDRLIRRWLAEGFIPKVDGITLWETGERYFNELINRRLVEPVFDFKDDEPVGCTVHGVVHDFIKFLSSEENFVTLGAELNSGPFPCDRIRRFSVNCSDQDKDDTLAPSIVHLSGVRSFTFYGNVKEKPDLSAFKLIRVLDLKGSTNLFFHLTSIGSLPLLRYLGLAGTSVEVLPENIVDLEHLTTLDIRQNSVRYLPVFRSVKLVSLLADDVELSREMSEMPELEELSTIRVDSLDSMDTVAELVTNSKRMRMLGVILFSGLQAHTRTEQERQRVMHFLDKVGESSLQSLYLEYRSVYLFHLLLDCWTHKRPRHLQKFELRLSGYLSKIPQKMASMIDLTHLHIRMGRVEAEGLRILGNLPNLVCLTLTSDHIKGRSIIISKDSFPCLKVFCSECRYGGMMLRFEAGAMPQLRRLRLCIIPYFNSNFDFGIQHLSYLVHVHATILCYRARASDVEAAEDAIRDQVCRVPNNPLLELSREEDRMITDAVQQSTSRTGKARVAFQKKASLYPNLSREDQDLTAKDEGKNSKKVTIK